MFSKSRVKRALQLESLENRRMFVVEISVQPPVVSAFSTFAEVRGLKVESSTLPIVTHTIDNAGVRQAIKEIDGILYSFQGNSVFLTDIATGATQSRTLTGLAGSTGVQVKDVALVAGEIVYVGRFADRQRHADQEQYPDEVGCRWHTPHASGRPARLVSPTLYSLTA